MGSRVQLVASLSYVFCGEDASGVAKAIYKQLCFSHLGQWDILLLMIIIIMSSLKFFTVMKT